MLFFFTADENDGEIRVYMISTVELIASSVAVAGHFIRNDVTQPTLFDLSRSPVSWGLLLIPLRTPLPVSHSARTTLTPSY